MRGPSQRAPPRSLFCTMESGERAAVPCMATAKLSKTSLATKWSRAARRMSMRRHGTARQSRSQRSLRSKVFRNPRKPQTLPYFLTTKQQRASWRVYFGRSLALPHKEGGPGGQLPGLLVKRVTNCLGLRTSQAPVVHKSRRPPRTILLLALL